MKFPHFFINRPIFAVVLSVLMLIAGAMAVFQLPLSEYPSVTPPTVQVTASYPGANPQVIADTVAAPLEQAVNGVEGMIYMASQTATDGQMVLTISFQQGIDPDFAQIQVQNRVSRALPRLPEEVQRIGVVTEKTSPDILMVVHMLSPGNQYDPLYVSNYSMLHVRDELARLSGVANVIIGGEGEYAMRVWLDPTKVASRGLTAGDVVAAIREQNVEVVAGSVGQQPDASSAFQVSVSAMGRLTTEEQFGDIVVNVSEQGAVTKLRDVARLQMGADNYAMRGLLDGDNMIELFEEPDLQRGNRKRLGPRRAVEKVMEGLCDPDVDLYSLIPDAMFPLKLGIDTAKAEYEDAWAGGADGAVLSRFREWIRLSQAKLEEAAAAAQPAGPGMAPPGAPPPAAPPGMPPGASPAAPPPMPMDA